MSNIYFISSNHQKIILKNTKIQRVWIKEYVKVVEPFPLAGPIVHYRNSLIIFSYFTSNFSLLINFYFNFQDIAWLKTFLWFIAILYPNLQCQL